MTTGALSYSAPLFHYPYKTRNCLSSPFFSKQVWVLDLKSWWNPVEGRRPGSWWVSNFVLFGDGNELTSRSAEGGWLRAQGDVELGCHWHLHGQRRQLQARACAALSRLGAMPPVLLWFPAQPSPSFPRTMWPVPVPTARPPPHTHLTLSSSWEDKEALPECAEAPQLDHAGRAFPEGTRGAKTWDYKTVPCAQRTPRGAAIGLNGRSPARLVYVTLKGCIRGMCSAVVKCSTDASFYYDVYHRVVARPKWDHTPIKWPGKASCTC